VFGLDVPPYIDSPPVCFGCLINDQNTDFNSNCGDTYWMIVVVAYIYPRMQRPLLRRSTGDGDLMPADIVKEPAHSNDLVWKIPRSLHVHDAPAHARARVPQVSAVPRPRTPQLKHHDTKLIEQTRIHPRIKCELIYHSIPQYRNDS